MLRKKYKVDVELAFFDYRDLLSPEVVKRVKGMVSCQASAPKTITVFEQAPCSECGNLVFEDELFPCFSATITTAELMQWAEEKKIPRHQIWANLCFNGAKTYCERCRKESGQWCKSCATSLRDTTLIDEDLNLK